MGAGSIVSRLKEGRIAMRVGFDARWYNDSGVGTYVAELVRALARAPRQFELVVYEDPLNRLPGLEGFSVVRIPVRSSRYSFSAQWELRRRAREDHLDLFHSPFYAAPLVLDCPLIVTIHDLIPFLFRLDSWPKQTMVKTGYRLAARRAIHIIADSENTARDVANILNFPAARISTVPLAAGESFQPRSEEGDLDRLRKTYQIQPPYIVLPSARNWRTKNLESGLRALDIARRRAGVDFQVVIYGPRDGIDVISPRCLAGMSVRQIGYVNSPDLAALLRHAHAFVMTSLYEGFGLPLVEAMACGCAVVSSNAGSLAEVAGAGAQVFAPFDVAGMGEALARFLTASEELAHWRTAALRRAADFEWAKTATKTMSIYYEVLRRFSPPQVAVGK
jgi:glycosyltransferase involved in cell wall biosynthesis